MMICPYCGRENPDTLLTCDYCSAPLGSQAVEQPASPPETMAATTTWHDDELPESLRKAVEQAPVQPATGIYGNKIWWFIGGAALLVSAVACGALVWGLFQFTNRQVSTNPARQATAIVAASKPTAIVAASTATTIPPQETDRASKVIFFDDFSDPSTGWDQVNEADYSTDYYNGTYRILVNTDMSDIWGNPSSSTFGDISIEVDATKNGGPDDNDFGVICRYQDVDAFYYAIISSDGYYGIFKMTSESSDLLGHDELLPSDSILQGEALNHIRFDCLGSQLSLYANGMLLDQQADQDYGYGNVGLLAGTYDISGADILFDNFTVFQP
jgi:hypothetical protein